MGSCVSLTISCSHHFFNSLYSPCRLARVVRPASEDIRQYLCSQNPHNFKHIPVYAQEAIIGISWSHTVEHHQVLEAQGVEDNLRTALILQARAVLASEHASIQLKALGDTVHELQRGSNILAAERDQAVETVAKATINAEHARAAKAKFMKAAKITATQLVAERKRKEDLPAKVGGLKIELNTCSAELEAKCSDLQNNLQDFVQELEVAKKEAAATEQEAKAANAKIAELMPAEEVDTMANC